VAEPLGARGTRRPPYERTQGHSMMFVLL
jgi:hypothetical protein